MRFFRPQRVSSLIQEKLGWLLTKEIEVAGALISITGVEVGKDLEQAKVRITVYPSEKSGEAMKILGGQAKHLEYLLLKQINIKPMPHIVFELDRGPENAANIEKVLLEDNNSNK